MKVVIAVLGIAGLFGVAHAARPAYIAHNELVATFVIGDQAINPNEKVVELSIGQGGLICGPAKFIAMPDSGSPQEIFALPAGKCVGGVP